MLRTEVGLFPSEDGIPRIMFMVFIKGQKAPLMKFGWPAMSRNVLNQLAKGREVSDQDDAGFHVDLTNGIVQIESLSFNCDEHETKMEIKLPFEVCKNAFEELKRLYPIVIKARAEKFGGQYDDVSDCYAVECDCEGKHISLETYNAEDPHLDDEGERFDQNRDRVSDSE
jgi:hypothetical protein